MASDGAHMEYPGLPLNLEDNFHLVEISQESPQIRSAAGFQALDFAMHPNTKLYRTPGGIQSTEYQYSAKAQQEIALVGY
jgi:hypothetical protein